MWAQIPWSVRLRLLRCYPMLFLAVLLGFVSLPLLSRLESAEAPAGIVSFQLAGTSRKIESIFASWTEEQRA